MGNVCEKYEMKTLTCVANEPEGIVWLATNYTNGLSYCKKRLNAKNNVQFSQQELKQSSLCKIPLHAVWRK